MLVYKIDEIFKSYDNQKGPFRMLFGDHRMITMLRNVCKENAYIAAKTSGHVSPYIFYNTLTSDKFKFGKNDTGAAYFCCHDMRVLCAEAIFIEAEKTWNNEVTSNVPLNKRNTINYQEVKKLTAIPRSDIIRCDMYSNKIGDTADSRVRVIAIAQVNAQKKEQADKVDRDQKNRNEYLRQQRMAAHRKYACTLLVPKPLMYSELPHPRSNVYYKNKVTVPYSEFETNYNSRLASCNNKIRQYNDQVDVINAAINSDAGECYVRCRKDDLARIDKDLNGLKNDLDNYVGMFGPPVSN